MIDSELNTLTRRASVMTMGGAGAALATTAASPDVGIAKKKKKVGKICKKKAKKRCNNDAAACEAQGPIVCSGDPTCLARLALCCAECSADGLLNCLLLSAGSASVTSAAFG